MLDVERLLELEEDLREILPEKLEEILSRLNRTDRLEEFLELIGETSLLGADNGYEPVKHGKILVLGDSPLKESVMLAVGKEHGLSKDRFEFCTDYGAVKRYDARKLQYNCKYSLILAGAMPHSCVGKGEFSSLLSMLERTDGYPPVLRLGANELKITKAAFERALSEALDKGLIAA